MALHGVWSGVVAWRGVALRGMRGVAWHCVALHGVAHGIAHAWHGVAWLGVALCVALHGIAWRGGARRCAARCGLASVVWQGSSHEDDWVQFATGRCSKDSSGTNKCIQIEHSMVQVCICTCELIHKLTCKTTAYDLTAP